MKRFNYFLFIACLALVTTTNSCKEDYLEIGALGSTSEATLTNKAGVKGLLTGRIRCSTVGVCPIQPTILWGLATGFLVE